jgi:hypothetical protein
VIFSLTSHTDPGTRIYISLAFSSSLWDYTNKLNLSFSIVFHGLLYHNISKRSHCLVSVAFELLLVLRVISLLIRVYAYRNLFLSQLVLAALVSNRP